MGAVRKKRYRKEGKEAAYNKVLAIAKKMTDKDLRPSLTEYPSGYGRLLDVAKRAGMDYEHARSIIVRALRVERERRRKAKQRP